MSSTFHRWTQVGLWMVLGVVVISLCVWLIVSTDDSTSGGASLDTSEAFRGVGVEWGFWKKINGTEITLGDLTKDETDGNTPLLFLVNRVDVPSEQDGTTRLTSFVVGFYSGDTLRVLGFLNQSNGRFFATKNPEDATVFKVRALVNDAFYLTALDPGDGRVYGWRRDPTQAWVGDRSGVSDSWLWVPQEVDSPLTPPIAFPVVSGRPTSMYASWDEPLMSVVLYREGHEYRSWTHTTEVHEWIDGHVALHVGQHGDHLLASLENLSTTDLFVSPLWRLEVLTSATKYIISWERDTLLPQTALPTQTIL